MTGKSVIHCKWCKEEFEKRSNRQHDYKSACQKEQCQEEQRKYLRRRKQKNYRDKQKRKKILETLDLQYPFDQYEQLRSIPREKLYVTPEGRSAKNKDFWQGTLCLDCSFCRKISRKSLVNHINYELKRKDFSNETNLFEDQNVKIYTEKFKDKNGKEQAIQKEVFYPQKDSYAFIIDNLLIEFPYNSLYIETIEKYLIESGLNLTSKTGNAYEVSGYKKADTAINIMMRAYAYSWASMLAIKLNDEFNLLKRKNKDLADVAIWFFLFHFDSICKSTLKPITKNRKFHLNHFPPNFCQQLTAELLKEVITSEKKISSKKIAEILKRIHNDLSSELNTMGKINSDGDMDVIKDSLSSLNSFSNNEQVCSAIAGAVVNNYRFQKSPFINDFIRSNKTEKKFSHEVMISRNLKKDLENYFDFENCFNHDLYNTNLQSFFEDAIISLKKQCLQKGTQVKGKVELRNILRDHPTNSRETEKIQIILWSKNRVLLEWLTHLKEQGIISDVNEAIRRILIWFLKCRGFHRVKKKNIAKK